MYGSASKPVLLLRVVIIASGKLSAELCQYLFQIALTEIRFREIGYRKNSAAGFAIRQQRAQLRYTSFSQRFDRVPRMNIFTVSPIETQFPVGHAANDIQQVAAISLRTLRLGVHGQRASEQLRRSERSIDLSEIIEPHCGLRCLDQLVHHVCSSTQVPQHAIADAAIGNSPQLLLDVPQRFERSRGASYLDQHRKDCRKPADRARQVNSFNHVLATVPLEIDQQRRSARPARESSG